MGISLALLNGLITSDVILTENTRTQNFNHEHGTSTMPACYHRVLFFWQQRHSSCAATQRPQSTQCWHGFRIMPWSPSWHMTHFLDWSWRITCEEITALSKKILQMIQWHFGNFTLSCPQCLCLAAGWVQAFKIRAWATFKVADGGVYRCFQKWKYLGLS